ncbi:MAG TPA: redoxin domain-containing protein [Candidatus Acidoferrales bacterium]|nr:redoxin domain-containing protein [Candidatus Acidoferrales bacterium]
MKAETYPAGNLRALIPILARAALLGVLALGAIARAQQPPRELAPETLDLIQKGSDAIQSGRYDQAAESFKQAIKIEHGDCFWCWLGLARAEGDQGLRGPALKDTDSALKTATDDEQRARTHGLRGLIHLAEVVHRTNGFSIQKQVAGGYFELRLSEGQLKKYSRKDFAEAEQEYRMAVKLDGSVPEYHAGLARVLFFESRDDEAKQEGELYLQLAPDGADSRWLRVALDDPQRARHQFAPDFEFATSSGDTVSLKSLAGKIVVLDFWATWCPACRASTGELKALTHKYPSDQVVLVSVSADIDGQQWRQYIAEQKMDWAQYWDEDKKVRRMYGIQFYPTYIVIDRDGAIRQRIVGMDDRDSLIHRLKQTLETLSPEKGS